MRDALRSRYQNLSRRHAPRTPDQCEKLALRVLSELDPTDHLQLSKPAAAERLRSVVQRIVNPKCPWNE